MRVGVDVLCVGELDGLFERPWFRRYAYSAEELAAAGAWGRERAREFLTGRFACKEAVVKVLRCGFSGGVVPNQVSVLRDTAGAPEVRLTGHAAERARAVGVAEVTVSIAHKRGLVIAVAVGLPARASGRSTARPGADPAALATGITGRLDEHTWKQRRA
ncbi:phosphopantetheine--protein transferase-like protein [Spinactinospora alkalitolerans]|uniref:Holo-[acyl-carrier-protein] synthase n=1 Tax=Spinactinospora alkalitolerans TaxID=687207 RepID=A0A852U2Z4_9ACTN|nr:4'-phosphopantetheinyl transferase superfamily protein [Spinactinospora alkalitolerans]NYE50598.1 phosphopantetheine--protein transferase-like protein [Spinactinospora alkalitolerans]